MPKLLDESEVDLTADTLDAVMTDAEEKAAFASLLTSVEQAGDLSDGGMVGRVQVTPTLQGRKLTKGRPVARRAWRWDGTETVLPLAYDPSGKTHDGARPYLLKRYCTCCGFSGFRGVQCPGCVRNSCSTCRSSTVAGKLISCFYLKPEDVPYPVRFFGDIACFLPFCPRRGEKGFKTEEDMRVHARTRHRMEYQAYLDSQATGDKNELAQLRQQVAMLTQAMLGQKVVPAPDKPDRSPVTGTPERPLYVSDKDKRKASIQ